MEIIICALLIAAGTATAASAVYNRFIRSYYPDPKRWIRVRIKSGMGESYMAQTYSKYGSGIKYGTEYPISYTVEGKTYSAYTNQKCTHIFCRRKNPKNFKQTEYFRENKRIGKMNSVFAFQTFMGIIILIIGISMMNL